MTREEYDSLAQGAAKATLEMIDKLIKTPTGSPVTREELISSCQCATISAVMVTLQALGHEPMSFALEEESSD